MKKQATLNSSGVFHFSTIQENEGRLNFLLNKNFSKCKFIENFVQEIKEKKMPTYYVALDFNSSAKHTLSFYKVKDINFSTLDMNLKLLEQLTPLEFEALQESLLKKKNFAKKTKNKFSAKFLLRELETEKDSSFSEFNTESIEVIKNENIDVETKAISIEEELELKTQKIKELTTLVESCQIQNSELEITIEELSNKKIMLEEQILELSENYQFYYKELDLFLQKTELTKAFYHHMKNILTVS